MDLNIVDYITLVVVGIAIIRGLWNGLLKEIAGICGLLLGLYLAGRWSQPFSGWLERTLGFQDWADEVAYVLLFLAGLLVVSFIVKRLSRLADAPVLGSLNSLGGLVAGGAKGVLFCGLVLYVLRWLMPEWSPLYESRLHLHITPVFQWILEFLPHWQV